MTQHAFVCAVGGGRLDQVVAGGVTGLSRRRARELIGRGSVSIDGVRVRTLGRVVRQGATILVVDDPLPRHAPAEAAITVIAESDDFIVINKPAGLATEPTRQAAMSVTDTLTRRGDQVAAVHRLDVDTSGVLVLARSSIAAADWGEAFREGSIERLYLGVVAGVVDGDSGVIDTPMAPPDKTGKARVVDGGHPLAKRAITNWEVIGRGDNVTLMLLRPQTGRTHQLRLHLAHVGHPLVGDRRYGRPTTTVHLGLHARALVATVCGEVHHFVAPLPPELATLVAELGLDDAVDKAPTR